MSLDGAARGSMKDKQPWQDANNCEALRHLKPREDVDSMHSHTSLLAKNLVLIPSDVGQ